LASIAEPTLLIYDNLDDEQALARYLPAPNLPVHLLITTTQRFWPRPHQVHVVTRLEPPDAHALVVELAGDAAAQRWGAELVARAGGITVELKAAARFAHYELEHGREPTFGSAASHASQSSFERAFSTLPADAQLAARVASQFNPAAVPLGALASLLDWAPQRLQSALDAVSDRGLATRVGETLRIHGLMCGFLRARGEPLLSPELVTRHFRAFATTARAFTAAPADKALRLTLASYPDDLAFWAERGVCGDGHDQHALGLALLEAGKFIEARFWFERAVAEAEEGDRHGRVDHQSLGASLHFVGYCFSQQGQCSEARAWFERAVAERERGDLWGRVDASRLAAVLRSLAGCLRELGRADEAGQHEQRASELEV
jgi:tetratricopeptide (TPR) repeat protein